MALPADADVPDRIHRLDEATRQLLAAFAFSVTAAKVVEIHLTHPESMGHLLNVTAILGIAKVAAATTYRRLP